MRPNCTIKSKLEKIIMSKSQPTKIIRDRIEKTNSRKNMIKRKQINFKKIKIKFDKIK
jgi:hypothetical protein